MNEFIAFLKTKKFWTIFAVVTIADYLFFNRALAVVPLIPSLYQFYDMIGLRKLIPSKSSTVKTETKAGSSAL